MDAATTDTAHTLDTELHGALLRVYVHGETGGSVLVGIDIEWETDADCREVYGAVRDHTVGSPVVECCEGMTHAELLALVPDEDWLWSAYEELGGVSALRASYLDDAFDADCASCTGGPTQSGLVYLGWSR